MARSLIWALMKKNLQLKLSAKATLVLEILLPILFFLVFSAIFPVLQPFANEKNTTGIYNNEFTHSDLSGHRTYAMYPKSPLTTAMKAEIDHYFEAKAFSSVEIQEFKDEAAMLTWYKNDTLNSRDSRSRTFTVQFPSNVRSFRTENGTEQLHYDSFLSTSNISSSLQLLRDESQQVLRDIHLFPVHDQASNILTFFNGTIVDLSMLSAQGQADILANHLSIDSLTQKKNLKLKFRSDVGSLVGEYDKYYDPNDKSIVIPYDFETFENFFFFAFLRTQGLYSDQTFEESFLRTNIGYSVMPWDEYRSGDSFITVACVLGVLSTLGYLASLSSIISILVQEREYRIKHLFELMGLTKFHSYFSLLLSQLLISIVPIFISTIIIYAKASQSISIIIIFVILLFHFISLMAFAVLVSIFFQSTKTAQSVGTVIYLLITGASCASVALPRILQRILAVISFQAVFGEFILNLAGEHFHVYAKNVYSIAGVIFVFFFQTLSYFFLAIYIANILPGEDANPLPPWYPFLPSFWKATCCAHKSRDINKNSTRLLGGENVSDLDNNSDVTSSRFIQPLSQLEQGKVAIRLRNVVKQFGDFTAVDNVSMDFTSNSLTAQIGHNGSGKTTIINMICGLYPQTSGTIEIFDQQGNLIEFPQGFIGFCPQQNALFPNLTVKQHLYLFSTIKQNATKKFLTNDEVEYEINSLLDRLKLGPRGDNKANSPTSTLSGGQKRKTCLAIALLHKPPICVLDEVSTGVDIAIQREIWAIIEEEKKSDGGKCFILTSHDMNESEIGDRVAILLKGQLMCYGSSLFLKEAFDIGYMLTFQKIKSRNFDRIVGQVDTSINTDSKQKVFGGSQLGQLTTASGQHIYNTLCQKYPDWTPHLHIHNDTQSDIVFSIKFEHSDKLPQLLDNIDTMMEELQITTVALGVTTLDDVFLKANSGITISDAPINASLSSSVSSSQTTQLDTNIPLTTAPSSSPSSIEINQELWDEVQVKINPFTLALMQILAIFLKRAMIQLRSVKSLFKIIILPIIGMLLIFWLKQSFSAPDPYDINISHFASNTPVEYAVLNPQTASAPLWDPTLANQFSKTLATSMTSNAIPTTYMNNFLSVSQSTDSFSFNLQASDYGLQMFQDIEQYSSNNPRYFSYSMYSVTNLDTTKHSADFSGTLYFNATNVRSLSSGQLHLWNTIAEFTGLDFVISTIVQRLPSFTNEIVIKAATIGIVFICAIIFPQTISFFLVKERQDKIFHLHTLSGISLYAYWIGNFLFDIFLFTIMSVVLILSIIILGLPHISLTVIITALATYGPASIFFLYWLQTFFSKPSSAQLFCGIALVLGPIIISGLVLAIGLTTDTSADKWSKMFQLAFIVPSSTILVPLAVQFFNETSGFELDGSRFSTISIALTFVHLALLCIIQILNAYGVFERLLNRTILPMNPPDRDTDASVTRINDYIRSKAWVNEPDQKLVSSGLRKVFKGFTAVNNVSFTIPVGTTMGLLGANGAGKSTVISMLTAEIKPSSSTQAQYDSSLEHTAYINHLDIVKNPVDCYQNVGVCPQFDALSLELTGRQTLQFYCFVRGIERHKRVLFINDLLNALGIEYAADRAISTYSLGMRRRLSIGVALVGNPSVVIIDEGTSGVDPISRANIALFLKRTCSNRSLLITSHIMADLEALADNLCILTYGNVKAVGGKAELKQQLGNEWTIHLSITPDKEIQTIVRFLSKLSLIQTSPSMEARMTKLDQLHLQAIDTKNSSLFSTVAEEIEGLKNDPDYKVFIDSCRQRGLHIVEQRYSTGVINVNKQLFSLSALFAKVQEIKASTRDITTYSCSQIPLEQVFIKIVEQADAAKAARDSGWYTPQNQTSVLGSIQQPSHQQYLQLPPQQYQHPPQQYNPPQPPNHYQ